MSGVEWAAAVIAGTMLLAAIILLRGGGRPAEPSPVQKLRDREDADNLPMYPRPGDSRTGGTDG